MSGMRLNHTGFDKNDQIESNQNKRENTYSHFTEGKNVHHVKLITEV